MKKLLIITLAILSAMMPVFADTHITILGTSDLHGNIWGFSYEDSKETANNGMARLYTYIESVRKENPDTLLIDAGDDIQGTIMTDDIYNKTPDEEHPVIAAMNYMGYDAMTQPPGSSPRQASRYWLRMSGTATDPMRRDWAG